MDIISYLSDAKTETAVIDLIYDNLFYYQNLDTSDKIDCFSSGLYNWFVQESLQNNQYLFLSGQTYSKLFDLYRELVFRLKEISLEKKDKNLIAEIVRRHRKNLIVILRNIKDIDHEQTYIIPCSEYSAELQQQVLRIDQTKIMGPLLDIGCGRNATLVTKMTEKGVDAYGIDQYLGSNKNIICKNWLDFDYGNQVWGTIVSHMAFSNHYRWNKNRKTELLHRYEQKYNEILGSLKMGGMFAYAPSLQEIETTLNPDEYEVLHFTNIVDDNDLKTTHIIKKNDTGIARIIL
jgi:hypothetical protein